MTKAPLRILLLSSLGALALAGCGESKTDPAKEQDVIAKVAAPAGKSWSATVSQTADGGYLMGNPDAPIKIIEFASLTCSHCAEFSKESHEEIKRDFIDTGRVSLEVRNFIRDPLDAMAAAVIRCGPVDRYFPLQENVFASQADRREIYDPGHPDLRHQRPGRRGYRDLGPAARPPAHDGRTLNAGDPPGGEPAGRSLSNPLRLPLRRVMTVRGGIVTQRLQQPRFDDLHGSFPCR